MTPRRRSGLRIDGRHGHPDVRAALVRYARWLRTQVEFPIRVPVYLLAGDVVHTMHGEACSASIVLPWDRDTEPYVRIATGDYPRLRRAWGRHDALASYLVSLSHEVVHYRQWCETGDFTERGVAVRARRMVASYLAAAKGP